MIVVGSRVVILSDGTSEGFVYWSQAKGRREDELNERRCLCVHTTRQRTTESDSRNEISPNGASD